MRNGDILTQEMLGRTAQYRVVRVGHFRVELEVLRVPGLPQGMRVRVLRSSAERMQLAPQPAGLTQAALAAALLAS